MVIYSFLVGVVGIQIRVYSDGWTASALIDGHIGKRYDYGYVFYHDGLAQALPCNARHHHAMTSIWDVI